MRLMKVAGVDQGLPRAAKRLQLLREFRHNSGALIAGRSNRRSAQRD
jgi:hypothetical protein